MTPRELSAASVSVKLSLMADLLDLVDGLGAITEDRLREDPVVRLALERIVTQLVETAASINAHLGATLGLANASGGYRESFELAASAGAMTEALAERLKPSAGLRNILVHNYLKLDLGILAESADLVRTGYREYVHSVATWLLQAD